MYYGIGRIVHAHHLIIKRACYHSPKPAVKQQYGGAVAGMLGMDLECGYEHKQPAARFTAVPLLPATTKSNPIIVLVGGQEEKHEDGSYFIRHENIWFGDATGELDGRDPVFEVEDYFLLPIQGERSSAPRQEIFRLQH